MIVAVASGKGGTGKTTVAVSLALAALKEGLRPVRLIDCDVEAPNAGLFLDVAIRDREVAGVLVPEVDADACNECGKCAEVCAFHAIAAVGGPPLVFPGLCHGCGSCAWICPEGAIREVTHRIGEIEAGRAGALEFAQGRLDIGQAMATPVIRQLKARHAGGDGLTVLDGPPGTACAAMEAVRGADVALLVTEPTPFGLHDLEQAVAVVRDALGIPVRIAINRADEGDDGVERYCEREGLPVLLRIPFDFRIAEAYSDGRPLVRARPEYTELFRSLVRELMTDAGVAP